nr:MAG TPA: hypothetical protein [Caudoviricetes sp.]
MFVKITNGNAEFEVTKAAFKNAFEQQGFRIIDDAVPTIHNRFEDKFDVNLDMEAEVSEAEHFKSEMPVEVELNEDDLFVQGMLERPISEWTKGELKRVAKIKGIDLSNADSTSKARQIVSKAMN